jgi:hypothetical protein
VEGFEDADEVVASVELVGGDGVAHLEVHAFVETGLGGVAACVVDGGTVEVDAVHVRGGIGVCERDRGPAGAAADVQNSWVGLSTEVLVDGGGRGQPLLEVVIPRSAATPRSVAPGVDRYRSTAWRRNSCV